MADITDLMNSYRECSRHLWNAYFGKLENTADLVSQYEEIRNLLFRSLVMDQIEDENLTESPGALPRLEVIPISSVPILIRRPSSDGNWYWDQEQDLRVHADDVNLEFQDYYDFAQYPVKDNQFYKCKVLRFTSRPEYQGRDALIEVSHARVLC